MSRIIFDNRWDGSGGIGTFADEINRINKFESANFSGKPVSPADTIKTAMASLSKRGDVIFFPGYIPPLFSKIPYVFTVHDLNHLDRPENSSKFKRLFYQVVIRNGCRKAKKILTVSEFSKRRIVEWSGINPNKVINVGNGVSESFNVDVKPYNVDFKYFLCVSNRKAHKNELRTLEAFSKANLPPEVKLVFTGKPNEELTALMEKLKVTNRVHFTHFVALEDLPSLYKSASGLVFASLYEGFGLPVIEAMACGTPVITSNTTSLPEVAGDAAILVNPLDVDDISTAMNQLYFNEALREKLIAKGFIQAKKFSWEKTAEKVRKALNEVIAEEHNGK